MSEKKRIELHSEKVISGLVSTAEKAAQESDIAELKKCFDGAVSEVTQLAETFDSMIRVMAMDNRGPRLIGNSHSDSVVSAMKEVSLAAIHLAKSISGGKAK